MRAHLEGLVGTTIPTITGVPNTGRAVEGNTVVVGTDRSPRGQPVPLSEIQDAADRLARDGELPINPSSVGYRSAFVGAALRSLPGTEVQRRPALVRLSAGESRRRNPPWAYDELVLALDLYKREGLLDDSDPKVVELSRLLNALPVQRDRADPERFRNPNGVAMKLANFVRFDPARPGSGLTRGGRREQEVWDRFDGADDELREVAAQMRAGVRAGEGLPPPRQVPEAPEVEAARQAARETAGASRQRPGRRQSAEERRAIELRAMDVAAQHYRDEGWSVEDVSATESYDLRCTRGGAELHVEVKGTTSERSQVVLTANEVVHARTQHPNVALVFVSEIELTPHDDGQPVAAGGQLRVIEPWRLDDGVLEALSYAYPAPGVGRRAVDRDSFPGRLDGACHSPLLSPPCG